MRKIKIESETNRDAKKKETDSKIETGWKNNMRQKSFWNEMGGGQNEE